MIKRITENKGNVYNTGKILTGFVCMIMMLVSCGNHKPSDNEGKGQVDTLNYILKMPDIPQSYASRDKKAEFLADHYWDNMNWNDTLLLGSERFMGESMATYGTLLGMVSPKVATASINGLINKLSTDIKALKSIEHYAFTYFYYPGAPQYDEELYLMFINPLLAQKNLPEEIRERLKTRKEYIMKNRVGSVASDFKYIGTDGKSHRLHSTAENSEYRVLMLYDPECEVCEDAIRIMSESRAFSEAQQRGIVSVIAINAYGQSEGGTAIRKKGMPQNWIVGYSPQGEIENEEIYAIRATPAVYVLDKDGKILMKDLSIPRLSQFVNNTE